jgi:hypothetical protein
VPVISTVSGMMLKAVPAFSVVMLTTALWAGGVSRLTSVWSAVMRWAVATIGSRARWGKAP